jgi:phosphoenolpyruvate-protein phosphotransferase
MSIKEAESVQGLPQSEVVLRGTPAVPGQALGPVVFYRKPVTATLPHQGSAPLANADVASEQRKVAEALASARADLERLAVEVRERIGAEESAIFEAQSLMATDPALGERAADLVASDSLPAHAAILAAASEQEATLAALDNPYLRERAADIRDVGERAARLAQGVSTDTGPGKLTRPSIILAEDLTPSETVKLDKEKVLGIGLSGGGPTSHVAVVARALGVPLVCGLGGLPAIEGGPDSVRSDVALLDGDAGTLILHPGAERRAGYTAWHGNRQREAARQAALRDLPARTPDGRTVRLVANVGSVQDAQPVLAHGAEGIGLLRTEFLFLDRYPDEAEQVAAYSAIHAAMPGREIVVRTMDLGGDKPPPYLDFGEETNPFLGWRGLRVVLDRPEMLRTQVRALLRAAPGGIVHIMFPMVSTLDELQQARSIVDAARQELEAEKIPSATEVKVGIMVEVPAAALMSDVLAQHVDFFSIGTNDLTQYTMAVDRGASRVAHLYSAVQPAVLRLISYTVEAAHQAGKWVGMCGEAAGNPEWAALWLGLGLDELSMSGAAIPAVKEVIRGTRLDAARALASKALQQPTLEDVEAVLRTGIAPLDSPGAAD